MISQLKWNIFNHLVHVKKHRVRNKEQETGKGDVDIAFKFFKTVVEEGKECYKCEETITIELAVISTVKL